MRNLTATICLTIAVLLGSVACAPNSGQGPVIASDAVAEEPKSGSEVLFKASVINLRSGPGLQFPVKRVLENAKGSAAVFDGVDRNWIKIIFEGHSYWVHSSLVQRN